MGMRDNLKAIIDAVADTGSVYNYKRYARAVYGEQLDVFQVVENGEETFRGFDIQAGPIAPERMVFRVTDGGGMLRSHTFYIRGYLSWNDEDESEITAETIAVAVQKALDDSNTLHDGGTYYNAQPAQITTLEGRRFASILVNFIEITQVIQEYTA